jgi:hypothetical protein
LLSSVASRYQQKYQQQEQEQQEREKEKQPSCFDSNDVIYSTCSLWLSGNDRHRPTVYLPTALAAKFRMDKPCRIALIDNGDGILLKFLHPIIKSRQRNNCQQQQQ